MNTKPFNIDKARAGHPVCTRDLRPVRILCYDRSDGYDKDNIVALVKETDDCEIPRIYHSDGTLVAWGDGTKEDLMLAPIKKSGWINIYRDSELNTTMAYDYIFDTEEEAKRHDSSDPSVEYLDTVKIEWEE